MIESLEFKPISLALREKLFDNIRLYDGKPSVTTVLKVLRDSPEFEKFKEFDMDRYNTMLKAKALLGTRLHEVIHETYLTGKFKTIMTDHSQAWMKFYVREWYKRQPKELEYKMIWDQVGWTCDGIFTLPGKWWLHLVDWKSCGQKIYDELLFHYKMQLSKYATMWNSTHPDPIQSCTLVFFSSKGWYKLITFTEIQKYSDMYDQVYEQFISLREQYNEVQSGISWVWESSQRWHWSMNHGNNKVSATQNVLDWIVSGMIWSNWVPDETQI